MVTREDIIKLIEPEIAHTDAFIVDVAISPEEDIVVELDSPTGVDLDFCTRLSRLINEALPEDEDFSLEVGTSSLSAPFKVPQQFQKHVGDPVEVLTADGRKLHGTLSEAGDDGFTLTTEVKEKVEGKKKPVMVPHDEHFAYNQVKTVSYEFKF